MSQAAQSSPAPDRSDARVVVTPRSAAKASFVLTRLRVLDVVVFAFCAFGIWIFILGKQPNPNDLPVSHWVNDTEDCTRAAASAIVKSGLPYPNFGTEPVEGGAGASGELRRITTVDMWLGPDRYIIPAALAANSLYPKHHPRHIERMEGTLPNFYPPGPPADNIHGMGGRVDVFFTCSMDEKYVASWGKGYQSNADGIEKVKAQYQARLATSTSPGEVTVNRRDDLGMIEVLMDQYTEANGIRNWRASYWPINRELRGPDGSVSSIGCADTRHDPEGRRYSFGRARCSAGFRFSKYAKARIDIYVVHIQQMPAVFDQVVALMKQAQQPSKE